jgi:hypothetical protein
VDDTKSAVSLEDTKLALDRMSRPLELMESIFDQALDMMKSERGQIQVLYCCTTN